MSLINPKYGQLKPTLEYLSDPVVLAQAWKKSHSYIRSHNWYADTLELDASTFNLEQSINDWSEELKNQTYKPSPMRLVPAPKADIWDFEKKQDRWDWKPKKDSGSEALRPLAHICIKDQTIATAIMMCVADAVESIQGPTVDKKKVSNYGNRLLCKWDDERTKATFRWGNSSTYSKYYKDYQRFLERSYERAANEKLFLDIFDSEKTLYEIHLDMSAFYDSIHREQLILELRQLVDTFYKIPKKETDSFWHVVEKAFNWEWHKDDYSLNDCLKVKLKNDGLPQGLVASGFLANVYLIAFDKACKSLQSVRQSDFSIHDYCRYVDDLRLIISVDISKEISEDEIKKQLVEKLQKLLPIGITLNPDKTKIIPWKGEQGETVRQMEGIQSLASGPIDMDSLEFAENSLDNLFTRAETSQFTEDSTQHPLATVHQPKLEVREDTLLRFVANRWTKLFKSRRKLTNQKELIILDAAQESVARRFVASWSRNPALTLLLKKGFQLFPEKNLLETVWNSLLQKINVETPICERNIAYYCLAEICRFSATDLKKVLQRDLPRLLLIQDYFEWLDGAARELLKNHQIPWYVKQQIGLLLIGKVPSIKDDGEGLLNYAMQIAFGETVVGQSREILPATIVAWQITKSDKVISSLCRWLANLESLENYNALILIAENDPSLFNQLEITPKEKGNDELQKVRATLGMNNVPLPPDLTLWSNNAQLASVIKSPSNPFVHENALIELAIHLIEAIKHNSKINLTPQALLIKSNDWSNVQNPQISFLQISENASNTAKDPRYKSPTWLNKNEDALKLYELGCLLRACTIGDCDFTSQKTLFRQDLNVYYGIKSSWFKRTTSMMHSPESLVGETAPMSSWVTELLFNLLQWPGLELEHMEYAWPKEITFEALFKTLKDRKKHQQSIYGAASNTPFYIERIKTASPINGSLRVINVQTLYPTNESLKKDFKQDHKDLRIIHRNHLADICKLTLKKLEATDSAINKTVSTREQNNKSEANLIIFPELSVHQDDIDLLESLSATTKAIIFAGIVFHEHEGKLINRALWLIPYLTPEKGIRWIKRWQGKQNMTKEEKDGHIIPWRPYQLIIELKDSLSEKMERGYRLSGSVCYDATDMKLTSDLRDISDAYVVVALNNDITTFDNMIDALHYHMYQHVLLVNTGEFGGSAAKAPFKLPHHRTIVHNHGNNQIAISIFEIDMMSLMEDKVSTKSEEYSKLRKMRPAGIKRQGFN
ncbi:RNA-directed DNA polymerase [Methylophilus sp. Leaf414]|uniref:RNA-directed DNA polymerase n=1 Tax=Methylophilus sp. Leaf414 TaxID=1736371 RepID=UPI0007012FB5|nr:RNA-directed DNA polymerase [Methylophilus sp. Leaf414]KQT36170.1 hypothetical protein ASG24_07840 [Methylophilus sp. Leaf414]